MRAVCFWVALSAGCGASSRKPDAGGPESDAGRADAGSDASAPQLCLPTDPDEEAPPDADDYACADPTDCVVSGCNGEICAAVGFASPCWAWPYGDLGSCGCFEGRCRWLTCEECPDEDGDGYGAPFCGGDDCDETDATVHPRWRISRIAEGDSPAIALEGTSDAVHIAFLGTGNRTGDLLDAVNEGDGWVVEMVDHGSASGRPAQPIPEEIVYVAGSSEVRLAQRMGTGLWTVQPIEAATSDCVGAAAVLDGTTDVVYAGPTPGELRLANGWDTLWYFETIPAESGSCPAMAIDVDGHECISQRTSDGSVVVTQRDHDHAGEWISDIVAESEWAPSLPALGDLCEVVYDVPGRGLFVSFPRAESWTEERLDEGGTAYESSISRRHVAFARWDEDGVPSLFYATDTSGEWVVEPIASSARSPSIRALSNDPPQVAWVDLGDPPSVWHGVRECGPP